VPLRWSKDSAREVVTTEEEYMHGRQMRDEEGRVFELQNGVWRSTPAACSFPGREIRCVVGKDERGRFRAGTEIGPGGNGGNVETLFAVYEFETKKEAIEFSRGMTRDFVSAEAERYLKTVTRPMKPGETIAHVQMDDGWCVTYRAPGGEMSLFEKNLLNTLKRSVAAREGWQSRRQDQDIDR
jgi:hypothetical protein